MSAVSRRLPNSLHQSVKKIAQKTSALMTSEYLESRGNEASKDRFMQILAKAKNEEPGPKDRR